MSKVSKSVQRALQSIHDGERNITVIQLSTGVQPEVIRQMIADWEAHLRNTRDKGPEW